MTILLPGTQYNFVFNPFAKENWLGSGGMSNVYKGMNSNTGEPVAIKVLYHDLSQNPMYLARARRESSIRLEHPNVIRVYDFIEHNNKYHLITEFLDGASIADELERKKEIGATFQVNEALEILKAILNGLKVLHSQPAPVYHRDIKSSNVMLCKNGGIKIMDFGVSKIQSKQDKKLTTVGVKLGTILYSAPEQVRGDNDRIDHRTDIYSSGITCYEMLTGQVPFNAPNDFELQEQIVKHNNIPKEVHQLLSKATAKEVEARYQNVDEFITAIDQYLNQPKKSERKLDSKPINWGLVSIIVSAVLMLVFLFLLFS